MDSIFDLLNDDVSKCFRDVVLEPLEEKEHSKFIISLKQQAQHVQLAELISCIRTLVKSSCCSDTLIMLVIDLIQDISLEFIINGNDVRHLFQSLRISTPLENLQWTRGVLFRQDPDSLEFVNKVADDKDMDKRKGGAVSGYNTNNENENESEGLESKKQQKQSLSLKLSTDNDNDNIESPSIPLRFHEPLLNALVTRLESPLAAPSHMQYPGEKDSFLSIPSVKISCPREYTVCMWLCVDNNTPTKGFLLYRSRCSAGGIDVIVSDKQEDNSWNMSLRSQAGSSGNTNTSGSGNSSSKGDIHNIRVTFQPNTWHLISIRHVNGYAQSRVDYVTIAVDGIAIPPREGKVDQSAGGRYSSTTSAQSIGGSSHNNDNYDIEDDIASHDLLYPFRSPPAILDTQWVFGLGLKGKIFNVCIYGEGMVLNTVRQLYSLGKYTPHMAYGVNSTQSTFDTGYLVLGSRYCKGIEARYACRLVPQLCVTVNSFAVESQQRSTGSGSVHGKVETVQQIGCGRIAADHVIMLPFSPEATITPLLNGNIILCKSSSWLESLINEGGVLLCLHMLSAYCSTPQSQGDKNSLNKRICAILRVLVSAVSSSVDCKEHFLQLHGFHIIAQCLARPDVSIRRLYVNEDIVSCISALVTALGQDALQGDGIASALQGLLLDFRIWGGEHALPARTQILRVICDITTTAETVLYGSIGTQRVLDLLRLYVFHVSSDKEKEKVKDKELVIVSSSAGGGTSSLDKDKNNSREGMYEACATCGQKMLENVLSVALTLAEESTMEEARATQRQLWRLPPAGKKEIEKVLTCLEETQSVVLAERLLLVLWELRNRVPRTILHVYRTERFCDTVALNLLCKRGYTTLVRKRTLGTILWTLGEELRKIPDELAKLRVYEVRVLGQSSFKKNTVGKTPTTVETENAVEEAKINIMRHELVQPLKLAWMQLQMLMLCVDKSIKGSAWGAVGDNGGNILNYDDFLSIMAHDGPLGTIKVWLVLPLLETFLKNGRASASSCQHLLMSINVILKTDRIQGETLCVLPSALWVPPYLSLANLGNHLAFKANSIGDTLDEEVAQTCVELTLDGLATVLECCSRLHCEQSFEAWDYLLEILHTPEYITNELIYLKRCVCLVMQRFSRNGDEWNAHSMSALVNILNIVEKRGLCANWPISVATSINEQNGSNSLLHAMTESELPRKQTHDERQILCFLIDIMAGLRKSAVNGAMHGIEQYVLRPGLRIIHGCLRSVQCETADRISVESIHQLQYMSETWGARNSSDFKKFFLRMVSSLNAALQDNALAEDVRGRYQAQVYSMMHHFLDLRHTLATDGRGAIASHIIPTLDLLIGVDTCNDVDTIFSLIQVNFAEANTISFVDDAPITSDASIFEGFPTTIAELLDLSEPIIHPPEPPTLHTALSVDENNTNTNSESTTSIDLLGDDSVLGNLSSHSSGHSSNGSNSHLDKKSHAWMTLRQGIMADRVDSERTRLSRFVQSMDVAADAVGKHWERVRHKFEEESFAVQHRCEWKLGVAHEGSFPGRRRLVLRPRRLEKRNASARSRNGPVSPTSSAAGQGSKSVVGVATDETSVAELGKAMKIYIREANGEDNRDEQVGDQGGDRDVGEQSGLDLDNVQGQGQGTGWGIVDKDESVEGFGVVGVDKEFTSKRAGATNTSAGSGKESVGGSTSEVGEKETTAAVENELNDRVMDVNGDLFEMDTAVMQGRMVETGPAHPGSRRFGSGAPIHESRVILITASGNVHGILSFNEKEIFFASTHDALDVEEEKVDTGTINLAKRPIRRRRWVISALSALYLRRFRLRDSAMEVFFRRGKHRNFFVDFGHEPSDLRARDEFAKKLIKVVPDSSIVKNGLYQSSTFLQRPTYGVPNSSLVRQHGVQDLWIAGKMSNFDYLMALNTIAGRSFNDLCQYPIMPWIIAQYTEETLDLTNPATFRDLSKPMGALNEDRLADALERYDSMEEEYTAANTTDIPPFMYGSHYSTMVGVVLHYLMRLQPFASLHCEMQGGRFDVADRLFSSIPRTWHQNTTHLSEVKELTPEWFTTPEIFQNVNQYDLGHTQDGEDVGNVILPPWAKSAEEFVHLNRQAMESDYVSAHLHEWIDLIFGYKQTGPASVEANNVFFYLTYYNAVDRDRIDEAHRQQIELQIAHFGQTPMQLFTSPHPVKKNNVSSALGSEGSSMSMSSLLSSVDTASPRPLRHCFTATAVTSQTPISALRKNDMGEHCLPMIVPHSVEEAAASNTKATCISLPLRIGAPLQRCLYTVVLSTCIVCVMENGVLEILKFYTSKDAKALLETEKRTSLKRRRNIKSNISTSSNAGGASPVGTLSVSASASAANDAIISFDDEYDLRASTSTSSNPSSLSTIDDDEINETFFALPIPLIHIEADKTHFDILPRLYLSSSITSSTYMNVSRMPLCTTIRGGFFLYGGQADGSISVRGIDADTGCLKSSGDFRAHRCPVVCIATDHIVDADTDVAVSVDNKGHILVWTISGLSTPGQGQRQGNRRTIISRRPQRSFRMPGYTSTSTSASYSCDIVWQMGIIATAYGSQLLIFSVERDELIRALDISISKNELRMADIESAAVLSRLATEASTRLGVSGTTIPSPSPAVLTADLLSFSEDMRASTAAGSAPVLVGETSVKRVVISDRGRILLHLEYKSDSSTSTTSIWSSSSTGTSAVRTFLAAQALTGNRVALVQCHSPVTYLGCPDHGDIAISGHVDGSVYIYDSMQL